MDIAYLLILQSFRASIGGALDGFMEFMTKLGDPKLIPLLLGALYWCLDKNEGIYLMFTFFSNRIVNGFLKITACVYRPWIRDPRVTPVPAALADATGYSFPSGHAANATGYWGGLAMKKERKGILRILLAVMVVLIAFSRNYLGVHTPQDVGVSILVGAVMLIVSRKILNLVEEKPERDVWILLGGALVSVALMLSRI